MIPAILADVDVRQIIGIIVLVISVLSWFVNVIQGNTPDGNPRQKKPKPQSDSSEIERLLKELTKDKNKPRQEQERKPQPQRPPKPPEERSRQKPNPQKQRQDAQAEKAAKRAARVVETNLPRSDLGAAVRTHHLSNRVEASVEKDIASAVQADLGSIAPATGSIVPSERRVHPLVKVLRDPGGVRQAILLNEILQRPKSMRR